MDISKQKVNTEVFDFICHLILLCLGTQQRHWKPLNVSTASRGRATACTRACKQPDTPPSKGQLPLGAIHLSCWERGTYRHLFIYLIYSLFFFFVPFQFSSSLLCIISFSNIHFLPTSVALNACENASCTLTPSAKTISIE